MAVECGRIGTTRLVDKIPLDSSELCVIRKITIDKTIARLQGIDCFMGEDAWKINEGCTFTLCKMLRILCTNFKNSRNFGKRY